jgi:hypothetical protein
MLALAFGDLQTETWGVTWLPQDEGRAQLALRGGAATSLLDVALRAEPAGESGKLDGPGISLEFMPIGAATPGADGKGQLTTRDELCQVSGQVPLEGSQVDVRCLGWRSVAGLAADQAELDSFRFLAGWLDPEFGFSLLALRPRRARGQDADLVAAAMVEDPTPPPVVDPRLSTTYTDAGLPRRAGLELWLEEEGEDEADEGGSSQYPRRAAGEVVAPGLDWEQGDFALHASLLRWHSHGHEGPGVYVLGRRQ